MDSIPVIPSLHGIINADTDKRLDLLIKEYRRFMSSEAVVNIDKYIAASKHKEAFHKGVKRLRLTMKRNTVDRDPTTFLANFLKLCEVYNVAKTAYYCATDTYDAYFENSIRLNCGG